MKTVASDIIVGPGWIDEGKIVWNCPREWSDANSVLSSSALQEHLDRLARQDAERVAVEALQECLIREQDIAAERRRVGRESWVYLWLAGGCFAVCGLVLWMVR